jgi:hypothetical protein
MNWRSEKIPSSDEEGWREAQGGVDQEISFLEHITRRLRRLPSLTMEGSLQLADSFTPS